MTLQLPSSPRFCLDGRQALVVGASSGIGQAAAAALADAGADVVVAARRITLLEELVATLRGRGRKATACAIDVGDTAATRAVVDDTGPFDVLVNSAGIARHGPALQAHEDAFDAVMAVNLRGAYFLSTAVAAGMKRSGKGGSIINISSQMGHVGGMDRSVYCASKHAVEGFTKAMAIEWGPHNIRVNTVAPTFIRTELTAATLDDPARKDWVMNHIKLGRLGEVSDITGAVIYLASDASGLVTGTSMLVDGGWTAE